MNENYIHIVGYVGTPVETRIVGEGSTVAKFRVASTPRRWNSQSREWVDAETNWYTVNAWRMLGRNCEASLTKGDAVTVYGKITTQVWRGDDGEERQTMVVDASHVGHDLNRGRAEFTRNVRSADDRELAESNGRMGVGGPQVSSDGLTLDEMVTTDVTDSADDEVGEQVANAG